MRHAIAVIPARGGSRRIPGKNIKSFFGKPILAYSIQKAQDSGLFDAVVVSTDSSAIAAVAHGYGALVYFRPEDFCADEVGTQSVASQYLRQLITRPSYACVIYATAPLMRIADLRAGRDLLLQREYEFVFGVQASPLQDAGQFYWNSVPALLDGKPLVGDRTGLIPIPSGHVCDINTMDDWREAERLFLQMEIEK